LNQRSYPAPPVIRSRLALEVASELVAQSDWPYNRAHLTLDAPGAISLGFETSGRAVAIDQVARGEAHLAMMNPAAPLALAVRGIPPFDEPIPLRAVAVIPSADVLAFAVTAVTGLSSLADVAARKYPLRISLRGQRDHSIHLIIDRVLAEAGFSLEDVVSWGGEVRYDQGLPWASNRLGAVSRGEVDAIFDEAFDTWADTALELGMRVLPLDAELPALEQLGLRRGLISRLDFAKLPKDVSTLDFSGWAIFTHALVPDGVVRGFCAALDARKDHIPWQGEGPLPVERMCRDTPEGPLNIPLHPAAERYWRERG
jgi:hypothetical protein